MAQKNLTARGIFALVALFFLANGLRLLLDRSGALASLSVIATATESVSSVPALWGGATTAIGISTGFAAYPGDINNTRTGYSTGPRIWRLTTPDREEKYKRGQIRI